MAENQRQSKDIWDIIDILGKVISSVLIGGIVSYFIQVAAQKISYSIEAGKLTQSLVEQLSTTTKDQQLRQDIALAALDGSIGQDKPLLVGSIAERIANSKGFDDPTARYALEVLKRREKERYDMIIQERKEQLASASRVTDSNASPSPSPSIEIPIRPSPQPSATLTPLPTPSTSSKTQNQVDKVSDVIAKTFSGLVFIQFSSGSEDATRALRDELVSQGFEVPDPEKVDSVYRSSIRYFNKSDVDLAAKIKTIVSKVDSKQKVEILDFTNSNLKVPKGQVEIWISSKE